jgi:SRSO17 transposase
MLMELSFSDLGEATGMINVIHSSFSDFFRNKTRDSIKQALQYLQGQILLNERGNMTNIEKVVPDCDHQSLQHFISNSQWDEEGVISETQKQVSELIGNPVHGSVHLDESGFLKDGENSVGVKRQYCGRFGKVDNCQVGVFLGYAFWSYRTLIDKRLYLPEDWANDLVRREQCGVPEEIIFKTKAELGLEMLLKARDRGVPFAWVGMDCFYGQQPWFLDRLDHESFLYIADVPNDIRVWLERPKVEVPKRKGKRGRHPKREKVSDGEPEPIEVRKVMEELPDDAWEHTFLRDTERKELWCDLACLRVCQVRDELPGPESWLILRKDANGEKKYQLSNASPNTKLNRLAEMSCSRYWIERALEDAKGEVGMADYEVRGWLGWHHHMTLVLLAMLTLLMLQLKWKDKAPMLTIQDVREILEVILPRRRITEKDILEIIKKKHKVRASARKSHHKRNSKPN